MFWMFLSLFFCHNKLAVWIVDQVHSTGDSSQIRGRKKAYGNTFPAEWPKGTFLQFLVLTGAQLNFLSTLIQVTLCVPLLLQMIKSRLAKTLQATRENKISGYSSRERYFTVSCQRCSHLLYFVYVSKENNTAN